MPARQLGRLRAGVTDDHAGQATPADQLGQLAHDTAALVGQLAQLHTQTGIIVDGSTPFKVDIPLGSADGTRLAFDDAYEITAAMLVNMIPAVISTSPGYNTFVDLGLPRPWFARPDKG